MLLILSSVSRRKGDERLSDVTGSDPRRTSGNRDDKRASKAKLAGNGDRARANPLSKSSPKNPNDVGKALRSVYDATLSERVPDDFLDLLGKLS
ncbi:MAG: NepR family anti-sigma factor [Sphingomicrobium sp.]